MLSPFWVYAADALMVVALVIAVLGRVGMVDVVRWLMILAAIVLSPLWLLWVAGGALYDARERRRVQSSRHP